MYADPQMAVIPILSSRGLFSSHSENSLDVGSPLFYQVGQDIGPQNLGFLAR